MGSLVSSNMHFGFLEFSFPCHQERFGLFQALKINGLDEVSYCGYSQFYKNQDSVIPRQSTSSNFTEQNHNSFQGWE